MKWIRTCCNASPFNNKYCKLDKGHQGHCFDGEYYYPNDLNINSIGRDVIFSLNEKLKLNIPITEETTGLAFSVIDDNIEIIIEEYSLGNCEDCDHRY